MSIATKYTAFAKAMQDMQALDIGLWQQLDADQNNWNGTYTPSMKADVAAVAQHGFPKQAAAIGAFWSDPSAWTFEKQLAAGGGNLVKGVGNTIANAGGAVGQVNANVAADVGKGLASAFDMSSLISEVSNKNFWLRIGEGLIGIILLGIGVSIMAKGTPVASAATKAGRAVVK